ncbi:MAG: transglutaminase domain-containing protein [Curvibacter sp.]|nr:MAG: transglutaminase domain-containing protein [Curvibacter sp.]
MPNKTTASRWTDASTILDFQHPDIQRLVIDRGWWALDPTARIGAVYDFVRDEVAFGYKASDNLPASQVLSDGLGQCNTKGNLFMALLRAVGIPCRFHGFTINKALQRGAITGLAYQLAPPSILHSWVEVLFEDRWVRLEGFILDRPYLNALQEGFADVEGSFCGFGVATTNLQAPGVDWHGQDTFIQKEGINRDFGVFDTPDAFYQQQGVNLSGIKQWLYTRFIRHWMNRNVEAIRTRKVKPSKRHVQPPERGGGLLGAKL